MKKQWKGFVSGIIATLIILGFAIPAYAAYQKQATLNYNDIKIKLNGQEVEPKDASGSKVDPFVMDGTTYVPVRAIGEMFGKDVSWDSSTNSVLMTSNSNALNYLFELEFFRQVQESFNYALRAQDVISHVDSADSSTILSQDYSVIINNLQSVIDNIDSVDIGQFQNKNTAEASRQRVINACNYLIYCFNNIKTFVAYGNYEKIWEISDTWHNDYALKILTQYIDEAGTAYFDAYNQVYKRLS